MRTMRLCRRARASGHPYQYIAVLQSQLSWFGCAGSSGVGMTDAIEGQPAVHGTQFVRSAQERLPHKGNTTGRGKQVPQLFI